MSREENKSGNDAETETAPQLPPIREAISTDSKAGPAQTATPTEPEQSDGHPSKRRRWALKGGAGILALAVALYFAIPPAGFLDELELQIFFKLIDI